MADGVGLVEEHTNISALAIGQHRRRHHAERGKRADADDDNTKQSCFAAPKAQPKSAGDNEHALPPPSGADGSIAVAPRQLETV
jgi:hypothetical protein